MRVCADAILILFRLFKGAPTFRVTSLKASTVEIVRAAAEYQAMGFGDDRFVSFGIPLHVFYSTTRVLFCTFVIIIHIAYLSLPP